MKRLLILLLFILFSVVTAFSQGILQEFIIEEDTGSSVPEIFRGCTPNDGVIVFYTTIPDLIFAIPDAPSRLRRASSFDAMNKRYVLCVQPTDGIGGYTGYAILVNSANYKPEPLPVSAIKPGMIRYFKINPKTNPSLANLERENEALARERERLANDINRLLEERARLTASQGNSSPSSLPVQETMTTIEYQQAAEKNRQLLDEANRFFDAGSYDGAFTNYNELKSLDNTDNTGYTKFLNKSKELMDIFGKCDPTIHKLLNLAKELNHTSEVTNLLLKCSGDMANQGNVSPSNPPVQEAITVNNSLSALEEEQNRQLLDEANRLFDAGSYDEAFSNYQKSKTLDNTGYAKFLNKGKELMNIFGECDPTIKKLLTLAKELNDTSEVTNLLSKCN